MLYVGDTKIPTGYHHYALSQQPGKAGTGHHTASAILANEAFTAAADPNRFPEQLKYVKTWQPKEFCGILSISETRIQRVPINQI
jgi:hypothetical protein